MPDFDVRGFDNDGANHSNDFDPVTDEGWFTPDDFGDLADAYRFYLKHYNTAESAEIGATGTGLFNPFLNMNGDSTLLGFNTNDDIKKPHSDAGLDISDPNTDAIRLGDIPIIYRDLDGDGFTEAYYLINLDINENVNTDVSLEELQLFTSSSSATLTQYRFDNGDDLAFSSSDGFQLRFDLDADADNKLILRDDGAGQGKLDYTFYFPVELFAGALSSDYLTLFSQFGPNPADDAGFAEWNVLNAAKISGTKFLDRNGDGVRDADGADNNLATTADNESPLAGFTVYIDQNGNNKLDANEQTALTDSSGHFEFASLLPNANYVIREVLTAADVNGPGDAGTDVSFATYAPPNGIWEQTTDPLNDGDQTVAVTTGTTEIVVGNHLLAPNFTIDKSIVSVVGGVELAGGNTSTTADNAVDSAGDQINYRITIVNTGDLALNLTSISDTLEAMGVTVSAASFTESGTDNNILDVGETWTWNFTETVSQAELDVLCADDETITNSVSATFNYNGSDIGPKTDFVTTTVVCNPDFSAEKTIVSVVGGVELLGGDPTTTADNAVDSAGDQINYSLVIRNTGNVTLDGETITDTFEGSASGLLASDFTETGGTGTNGDGILDVGETWTYNFSETVTQAELDVLCADDETITNTLAASFVFDGETIGPKGNTVNTTVVCNPDFSAEKTIVSVDGGVELLGGDLTTTADDAVDGAGDTINYSLVIRNTGNVTLDGESITDTFEGSASGLLASDFTETGGTGTNGDGILDVGETWTYNFSETVTQEVLDAACADDETISNTLAASFDFDGETLGPKGNTVTTTVLCTPMVELIKYVDVGFGFDDANSGPGPNNVNVGDDVDFKITIENTGPITLTEVDVTDTYLSGGAPGTPNLLIDDGALTAYALAHGAVLSGDDDDGDVTTGINADGILQVGETWTITYTEAFDPLSFDPGAHLNTADVTTAEGATDEDSAYYFSLINVEGPGVRTPGFWQNQNNGGQFWDGVIGNEKNAGQPCFADGDLLRIDSDGDGDIDADDSGFSMFGGKLGLFIGDYDRDGVQDAGEDILFISRTDALALLSSNTKDMNDMAVKIGRDAVASWLNYLAGNEIGSDPDAVNYSPKEAINDAIDYLQTYAGVDNGGTMETFDVYKPSHSPITNKAKPAEFAAGSPIHSALDEYNNFGTVNGHVFAHDCDDQAFVSALTVFHSAHPDLF